MPDSELDILIRTAADKYGVEEMWNSMQKYKNVLGETSEAAGRHNEHHREMHLLFREMNQILPESGHLLHGVFGGPQVLLIMGVVAAVAKLVEVLKEQRKETEELAKLHAQMEGAVWLKQHEQLRAIRQEYEKFNIELKAAATNFDRLKQSYDEGAAVLEVYNKAEEQAAGKDKEAAEQAKLHGEALKEMSLQAQAAGFRAAAGSAREQLTAAQAALEAGTTGNAGRVEAESKFAHEHYDEAVLALDKLKKMGEKLGDPRLLTDVEVWLKLGMSWEAYKGKLEAATEKVDDMKQKMTVADTATDTYNRQQAALSAEVKRWEDELKKRNDQARQTQAEADKARAVLGATIESSDEQKLIAAGVPGLPGHPTAGAVSSPVGRSLLRFIELMGRMGNATPQSPYVESGQDEALIQSMMLSARNVKMTPEKWAALTKELMDNQVSLSQKIDDLWNALHITQQKIQSTVNQ